MTAINFKIGEFVTGQEVDLTNCDREAIHIPGFIQPHGLLFVLKEPELTIVQLSNNTLPLLNQPPEALLNQNLAVLLEPELVDYLRAALLKDTFEANPLHLFTIKPKNQNQIFNGIIHRHDNLLVLELEPVAASEPGPNVYNVVQAALSKIQRSMTLAEFSQLVTEQVRSITGFDRVMVYRFNEEDGSGTVIAESRRPDLETFLDLHYPASDIPKQARALYLLNWLRLIADVNYQPAQVIPTVNPVTGRSLDMSYAVLRSVSPIHIEYLKNMAVGASMSISIIADEKLWGLIVCHDSTAKYIPHEIRTACEFLGQVISLQLAGKEVYEDRDYELKLKTMHARFVELMSTESGFVEALLNHEPNLLDFIEAPGVAICFEDNWYLSGQTPTETQVRALAHWLDRQGKYKEVFQTKALPSLYAPALEFKEVASGLLAITISKGQGSYVMWFLPEEMQTVTWAGNPDKLSQEREGGLSLTPRKSFEAWKQTVALKSRPWKRCEVEAAHVLRNVIVSFVLHQALGLAKLNVELERSNAELDAFAYIASHDLKEPLRGLHNYSSILLESYEDRLDEAGQAKLKTMVRLTERMEDLIESLLHFSQVGRLELNFKETNIQEVVNQVLDMLQLRLEETMVQVRLPRLLPSVKCDRVRVDEVFSNLISNAVKYNDKAEKWIEIGFIEPQTPSVGPDTIVTGTNSPIIFYVRDNGIGIRDKHFETIFRIFKRLHARDDFSGGTGAGLTIAKKVVERHGGYLRVESVYGEGTTFYFTLQS